MSNELGPLPPEFSALIRRNLEKMHKSHVDELAHVLSASLSLIHPNQPRTVDQSLNAFTTSTIEAIDRHLVSVQASVLGIVSSTNTLLSEARIEELTTIVRAGLHPETYAIRFEGYESAFQRRVASYGATLQLSNSRPDLAKALLLAGSSNRISNFSSGLKDSLLGILLRYRNATPTVERSVEDAIDQANRFIKLEPNVFGIGLNFNYLIRRLRGKRE